MDGRVSAEQFERAIGRVEESIADPRAGLFGPDTITWTIDREYAPFLCGGRAALLQLAHPFVAHAIDEHSTTFDSMLARFQRTFENMYAIVFGDLESALHSARRVRAIHEFIHGEILENVGPFRRGDRYTAHDREALAWVHATLIDGAVLGYELAVRPLRIEEKERYWAESIRSAAFFGIEPGDVPASWGEFIAYRERMFAEGSVLAVGERARRMGQQLVDPSSFRPSFAGRAIRALTVDLLPERIRREFGFVFTPRRQLVSALVRGSFGATYKRMPARLRFVPAYVEARSRLEGTPRPDRIGRKIERVLTKSIRDTPATIPR